MKDARYRGLGLWVFVLLAIAGSAHATINMTGRWVLGDGSVLEFTQVGTALTQTPPSAGEPGPRTGTIDPATGTFTVSDPLPCVPLISCTNPPECAGAQCGLAGTVAPDGLTFTGTFACAAAGTRSCMVVSSGDVMGWRSPPTCGNGIVDPGEQCDDGTNLPGSCCDPGCRFVASGTPCGSSSNVCIETEVCDGAGTCATGPPLACDQCSRCDPTAAACVPDPATVCRVPIVAGAAALTMKTNHPSMKWKWLKGETTTLADFGDPVHTDEYALCLYDESGATPSALLRATLPPGTSWRAAGQNGFTYKDKLGVADGVTTVALKAGTAGKATIAVSAKGPHLTLPTAPLPVPVNVQLRRHGECWGASYIQAGVKKNTASEFVAKSSPSGAFLDDVPNPGVR